MTSRRLELFRFRYRDASTGKWLRARYRAERRHIEERYTGFEIIGPPEIREVNLEARSFDPHFKLMTNAELRRFGEKPLEFGPHLATPAAIDAAEVFLVRLFLRRYVTFCARRRRFAAMNGAARLLAEVRESKHAPSS
jgi:hypothetical protein